MSSKIVSHKDEIKNMTDDTIQDVLELCSQTAEYHAI